MTLDHDRTRQVLRKIKSQIAKLEKLKAFLEEILRENKDA